MYTMDDCVAYFKKNEGFARLMNGLFDMYVRYERCYGAVRLASPEPDEEKAISDFFKRDYYNQALIRISLADFERQLQKNFSESILLEPLLESFFRRPVVRRTGIKATVNVFTAHIENDLMPRYADTNAEVWLRELIAHTRRTYKKWAEMYNREPDNVSAMLENICKILNNLPCLDNKIELFSDYFLDYGGDAYAYSFNGEWGPLFLRALARNFDVPLPVSAEDASALYFKAGLLTEGILNQVTVRGIKAVEKNKPDEICSLYNKKGEPHVLTLQRISHYTKASAHYDKVYIVENLPVFSAVNELIEPNNPCTFICIENGLNEAAVRLLNLLSASGAVFYYSGDMDYAGLALADKLYVAYPKQFKPWQYDKDVYERIASENDFHLPEHKKEQGLYNEDLASLLSQMRKKGKTAKQTTLIPDLARDINEIL
jgi:uncharacterized protein (TIGR02679 family)